MLQRLRDYKAEVFARWSLRHCTSVGDAPRCRALPLIENRGTLKIGDHFSLWSHLGRSQLAVGAGGLLTIGDNVFINSATTISAQAIVAIGNNVQIANWVSILDSDFHGLIDRDTPAPAEAICIEDDVWIATKATVLKGVTIARGAVVAAGSVVTRDVEAYTLVGGVPARPIRKIGPHPAILS
ncbi:acyltransferase [Gloeobacter kilaueensis]|uniref:Galactoside O-acetyltransferase n=1 Tax=Gloeobacter kilaueensis (strain ATCC BAA-2537 / CCAP 1431/1 / ULC 316 / JS1) TaxID=1183438 RepID=U5QIC3_GLOK1|nr:acyltransferase [Gloeobacter kilaueensis]AGY58643.1 galactoside O-acetyltransferase [Gloeobacter kilaueensis JS1]